MNDRPAPTGTFLLFVYGTLKRDGCRHGLLARQRFLGPARTQPLYTLYHLGDYPGMVREEPGHVVHGELYEVQADLLDWLDQVEGAPDWFRLARVELQDSDGLAWSYFYQQDRHNRPILGCGIWDNSCRGGPA